MSAGSGNDNDRISRRLKIAYEKHLNGNLPEAENLYLELIELDPGHPQLLYLLGTLKAHINDPAGAVRFLSEAIRHNPKHIDSWINLGGALLQLGRLAEAEAAYQAATERDPANAGAWYGLGLSRLKRSEFAGAQVCFEKALAANPGFAQAHFQLGLSRFYQGHLAEAVENYRAALQLKPQLVHIHSELGKALQKLGKLDEAATAYRQYVQARPDAADGWNNLGLVQRMQAHMDDAAESCRRALKIDPGLAETWNNLGNNLKVLGQFNEAINCYRRAIKLKPAFVQAHSNLLLCLNYVPSIDERQLFQEHLNWAERNIPPVPAMVEFDNTLQPERRLRIGYVSPDLRSHAVTRLFEPLLAAHDHDVVDVTCYAQVAQGDDTTIRLQSLSDGWCCTVGMSDEELSERIRADGIDILVDLAGHTARNRLLVLGKRSAPIQVSWLGYPNTTGMSAVDYRLTDWIADPDGADELYTEELVRLKSGLGCYLPPANAPQIGPLPALDTGRVTFGSLNNLVKLNNEVISLWSEILKQMPGARLLLFRDMLRGEAGSRVRAEFARCGIDEQLDLRNTLPPEDGWLSVYQSIDIALDTFPWNGHVTTCEALWMGVPVVTLLGPAHRGRLAASVLHQAGLDKLVAKDKEDYVRIACGLAQELDQLSQLRVGLRKQVAMSVLCDGPEMAHQVEDFYRTVWRRLCDSRNQSDAG